MIFRVQFSFEVWRPDTGFDPSRWCPRGGALAVVPSRWCPHIPPPLHGHAMPLPWSCHALACPCDGWFAATLVPSRRCPRGRRRSPRESKKCDFLLGNEAFASLEAPPLAPQAAPKAKKSDPKDSILPPWGKKRQAIYFTPKKVFWKMQEEEA